MRCDMYMLVMPRSLGLKVPLIKKGFEAPNSEPVGALMGMEHSFSAVPIPGCPHRTA